jgi:hypothetical protein
MLLGPLLHAFEFSGRRLQRRYPANGAICDTRLHGVLAREHVLCVDYAAARSIYIFDPACPTHQLITTNPPLCILILPRLASPRIASHRVFHARVPPYCATPARHHRPTPETLVKGAITHLAGRFSRARGSPCPRVVQRLIDSHVLTIAWQASWRSLYQHYIAMIGLHTSMLLDDFIIMMCDHLEA